MTIMLSICLMPWPHPPDPGPLPFYPCWSSLAFRLVDSTPVFSSFPLDTGGYFIKADSPLELDQEDPLPSNPRLSLHTDSWNWTPLHYWPSCFNHHWSSLAFRLVDSAPVFSSFPLDTGGYFIEANRTLNPDSKDPLPAFPRWSCKHADTLHLQLQDKSTNSAHATRNDMDYVSGVCFVFN